MGVEEIGCFYPRFSPAALLRVLMFGKILISGFMITEKPFWILGLLMVEVGYLAQMMNSFFSEEERVHQS
jgi:hypothetical protein